ncbi:GH3 auxin-responsive promoter family protein [Intestinibacillus massiliensis]|nr:GH3 auxin-responsive promoter family protein [Intestinibacillus massiliensis]
MRFKEKLVKLPPAEVWSQYCSFLDLSMDEYMAIQFRLLEEQIALLGGCGLGQRLFGGQVPRTVSEFRQNVPLTKYEDYADILLSRRADQLPSEPVIWLETTWESGSRPVKVAPCSAQMLETCQANMLGAMLLAASESRGKFCLKPSARTLYCLAPLPYASGLFPVLIEPEYDMHFMPPLREATRMSFSEQNKAGFKLAVQGGMDIYFGMSSIIYTVTKNFNEFISGAGGKWKLSSLAGFRPAMLYRLLKAKYHASRDSKPIRPRDLFDLQALLCIGTDTVLFKDELEDAWGRRPLEIHGGTEPTCIGTETWSRDGLVLFPDACFYEFIPENEMLRNMDDPSYTPKTYLMDELTAGQDYELVITVLKGGSFTRYRVGDMYRCLRLKNERDGLAMPQFEYLDRVPSVIDIAGFTRITEGAVKRVIQMSRLEIADWFARKEYDGEKRAFMHLYVEVDGAAAASHPMTEQILREHMSIYFRHYDHDYKDLKRLLGIEPLQITLLREGVLAEYHARYGRPMRRINPPAQDIIDLMYLQNGGSPRGGDGFCQ